MKKFLLIALFFVSQHFCFAQDSYESSISLDEVQYYYLEAFHFSGSGTKYYSEVKLFDCDKSKYLGKISNLKLDLESQFKDHLGDKENGLPSVSVKFFNSLRKAKISHRKEINRGKTKVEFSFQYYCKE